MSKIVHIKHEAEKTVLSKAQKKFNSLNKNPRRKRRGIKLTPLAG